MIKINVDVDGLMRLKAEIEGKGKQVRFATMRALNAAAFKAKQETEREIGRVFDRPTPWIKKSVRYRNATRDKLESQVDFDFWGNKQGVTASQVLNAEIHGGARRMKRHEVALQRVGILPPGMRIIPGDAAKMDAYGNMQAGQINQIMSWFQAFGEQGYRANMRDGGKRLGRDNKRTGEKGFSYIVLHKRHGKLLPGVYQRFQFMIPGVRKDLIKAYAVKPVMIFVRTTNYKRRLDFYGLAEKVARAEFAAQFPVMLDEAMRTAR